MRKSIVFSLITVCFILLTGIFAQLAAQELDVKKFSAEAEKIRGLKFEKEVKSKTVTREEFKKYLEKEVERQGVTKEMCKKKDRVAVKLGFYSEDYDSYKETLALMSAAAAAVYDPREKCVIMIEQEKPEKEEKPAEGMEAMLAQLKKREQESTLVHELTHALEDQIFKIAEHLELNKKPEERSTDKMLGAKALMEGSAMTAQLTYFLSQPSYKNQQLCKMVIQQQKAQPVISKQPEVVQVGLLWQYEAGMNLVHMLLNKGGNKKLDEAFKNPPVSTEQVLHPEEKYLKRDEPTTITLDDKGFSTILEGWELLDKSGLGELFTNIYLKKYIGKDEAEKAAAGWDGDEYAAFGGKEEKELVIIWLTVWDSDKDRDEFFDSYKKATEKKYKGEAKPKEDSFTMSTGEGNVFAQKKGNFVLCIDGAPDARLEKLTEEAWKNAKEQEENKEEKKEEETKEEK